MDVAGCKRVSKSVNGCSLEGFRPVVFLKGKKPADANLPWAKAQ